MLCEKNFILKLSLFFLLQLTNSNTAMAQQFLTQDESYESMGPNYNDYYNQQNNMSPQPVLTQQGLLIPYPMNRASNVYPQPSFVPETFNSVFPQMPQNSVRSVQRTINDNGNIRTYTWRSSSGDDMDRAAQFNRVQAMSSDPFNAILPSSSNSGGYRSFSRMGDDGQWHTSVQTW